MSEQEVPEEVQKNFRFLKERKATKIPFLGSLIVMGGLVWFVYEVMNLEGVTDSIVPTMIFVMLALKDLEFGLHTDKLMRDQNSMDQPTRQKIYAMCHMPVWQILVLSAGSAAMTWFAFKNEELVLAAIQGTGVIYSTVLCLYARDFFIGKYERLHTIYARHKEGG